jgi:type I restriction enzyme S subunit
MKSNSPLRSNYAHLQAHDEQLLRLGILAERIEARHATAQKTVERLTPATLAKAFRGELVPQDLNDEPASTLLERITSTNEAAPTKSKPKTRRVAKL